MRKPQNKTKISTIALILVLTISAMLVALPIANAQEPPRKKTYAFIGAVPNPVGVDQTVLLHCGITDQAASIGYGWEGLTVTVTLPDGTTTTLSVPKTDSTGGTGIVYVPNQVGTYYLQTNFPEQENPITFYSLESDTLLLEGTVMEASSAELELVVQEESIPYYPGHSLPTEYWTRPIDAQLREWSTIAGNWLRTPPNVLAPYNDGPESAHILWAKPLTTGGLAGGETGNHGMECGDAYEGKFQSSVIINGVLYYNRFPSTFWGPITPQNGIVAVDLHTGEELWFRNNTVLAFGQAFYFDNFNYHGVYDYIWETQGSTWNAYDPFNGEWVYSMTNVPSGSFYYGPNGEIYILTVDTTNGWMALWSSVETGQQSITVPGDLGSWGRFVHGYTWDASNGYVWNKTIPTGLGLSASLFGAPMQVYPNDRVVGISYSTTEVNIWGLSLKPGQEGQSLFNTIWQPPAEWAAGTHIIHYTGATSQAEDGVIALWSKELRRHYGFSVETGNFLWETDSEHYLNAYGFGSAEHSWFFAYDKLYSTGVAGILYCYDLKTGATLWTYDADDPYQEILWANNWWGRIPFITDGKVYLGHAEHSPIDPKPRGAPFVCLDAETGELIWESEGLFRQTHWGGRAIIGDSIIATMDTYDQRIYAIGKGPSATTVTVQDDVIPKGDSVLIKGIVTDESPGTKEYSLTARFPSGVPAIADDDMSEWMLYVYKQFERPADAKGVEVTLDAIDPNGNWIHIDRVTSDTSGFYSCMWEPEIPGKYTIIATFEGSKSYWASYAETAIGVTEGITAEEIAQKVLDELPASPSAGDIAGAIINQLPEGLTAQEVADKVLANLPDGPSAEDVAQEILNQLPEEAEAPAYTTIDLAIIAAVVVVAALVVYTLYTVRKQRK